jgi:hypothetical protein
MLMKVSALFVLFVAASASSLARAQQSPANDAIRAELATHRLPLKGAGEEKLLDEARRHDYLLMGELHGETEIPALLQEMWPSLWTEGYRHVGAEVSPWAAVHLTQDVAHDSTPIEGLWTRDQAAVVNQFAKPDEDVLWGCDIEEEQPERLIREAAALNPEDGKLQQMAKIVAQKYDRKTAPELLALAESDHPAHDTVLNGISLWQDLLSTLQVESLRSNPATKLEASVGRERVMKDLLLQHSKGDGDGKVLLRFGRNHLHRGYDARGVSTLGNFVTEWAVAQGRSVFNVGVFAAGGKEHLAGETFDADETQDELTFALLAGLSEKRATLFDLRPLRPMLHSIAEGKRTPLERNLTYWADSYDYLLCYPVVTPLSNGW